MSDMEQALFDYEQARRDWRQADDAVRRAEERRRILYRLTGERRAKAIAAAPTGAGLDVAQRIPWASLTHIDGDGWFVLAGSLVQEGLTELPELVRILGQQVTVECNGTKAYADPGETAATVLDRYISAGGVGALRLTATT
jgi:hypothetical protein